MKTETPSINGAHQASSIGEQELQAQERFEDELIMHLERDQFVAGGKSSHTPLHIGAFGPQS